MIRWIAPSILSADFSELASELEKVEAAGADLLHVDVMDGHFVPNLTFGPIIVSTLRKLTKLPLDVHLMISQPAKYAEQFVKAGADYLSFHIEACPDPTDTIDLIRSLGAKPGLVVNPPTPFAEAEPFVRLVDLVLVMTVNPGFGGQSFIEEAAGKLSEAVRARERHGAGYLVEVDGGINDRTGRIAAELGAEVFVAGNYVFKSGDIAGAVRRLKSAVGGR